MATVTGNRSPGSLVAWGALVWLILIANPVRAEGDFGPRLSPAEAAMEYWDITAWFASGHRFSARFLITNQGPGTRSGAAVAHLLLPSGDLVPIAYARPSERWILSDDQRRLKIASAVLDMTSQLFRVEIDSDKRGVKLLLEIPTAAAVRINPIPGTYAVEVLMPAAARGEYLLRGMATAMKLDGTAALTHTTIEKSEPEIVVQRAELLGHAPEVAIYVNDMVLADGGRRTQVLRRSGTDVQVSSGATLAYGDRRPNTSDAGYLVPARWTIASDPLRAVAVLKREYLRWDPLEMIPQPFRFLVSLEATPRRVWSDAEIELTSSPGIGAPAKATGVSVVTFARPGTLP